MSKRRNVDLLNDILEAAQRISLYSNGLDYDDFLDDIKTQDAVVHNMEIIGEAAKNLSDDFRALHFEIPWKSLAGMRDKLIHDYFGVNLDIVWGILKEDLAELVRQIKQVIANTEQNAIG